MREDHDSLYSHDLSEGHCVAVLNISSRSLAVVQVRVNEKLHNFTLTKTSKITSVHTFVIVLVWISLIKTVMYFVT